MFRSVVLILIVTCFCLVACYPTVPIPPAVETCPINVFHIEGATKECSEDWLVFKYSHGQVPVEVKLHAEEGGINLITIGADRNGLCVRRDLSYTCPVKVDGVDSSIVIWITGPLPTLQPTETVVPASTQLTSEPTIGPGPFTPAPEPTQSYSVDETFDAEFIDGIEEDRGIQICPDNVVTKEKLIWQFNDTAVEAHAVSGGVEWVDQLGKHGTMSRDKKGQFVAHNFTNPVKIITLVVCYDEEGLIGYLYFEEFS